MANYLSVTKCVYDATKFVFKNFLDCIFYIIPILLIVSLLAWAQQFLGGWYVLLQSFLEPFFYAMYAVAWHRYSALRSDQLPKGLPYRLGKREIKFGALSVLFTVGISALSKSLTQVLPEEYALLALLVVLVPILVTVIFIYPAIALDQPVRLRLFLNEGIKHILSFIVAIILVTLLGVVLAAAFYFISNILEAAFTPDIFQILIFAVLKLIIIPVLLAITTSSASFLYVRTFGLEEMSDEIGEPSS